MSVKDRLPAHLSIVRYWSQRGLVSDIGEPACFACGWYDAIEPPTRWDKASLERAHLVPEALGGTADVSNVVLLCARCHTEGPNTPDAEFMLRWIASREPYSRWKNRQVKEEFRAAGIDVSRLVDFDIDGFTAAIGRGEMPETIRHGCMSKCYMPSASNAVWIVSQFLKANGVRA